MLSRTQGLMAHFREAMAGGKPNIWRPQQIYTGDLGLKEQAKEEEEEVKEEEVKA